MSLTIIGDSLPNVICEKCGKYYGIKKGESMQDFEQCQCGGNLKYIDSLKESNQESNQKKHKPKMLKIDEIPLKAEKIKYQVRYQTIEQKRHCLHCGCVNRFNANFCKHCGKEFKINFIIRFNNAINFLAILIGLSISVLVLILSPFFYGAIFELSTIDNTIYIGLVLITVVFTGSLVTGIIGSRDLYDGAINGVFLSLITLITIGFFIGVLMLVTIDKTTTISIFHLLGTSAASTTSALNKTSSISSLFIIIKGIIIILLLFVAGIFGGSLGVTLKSGVKTITK